MCGRFTLRTPLNRLAEQFLFELTDQAWPSRFNIAPSQLVAVVRQPRAVRQLSQLQWGLVPSWAKDASGGSRLINARGESVDQKPSFRSAFRQRRCLVLADGYFEWLKGPSARGRQPYYVCRRHAEPFAFAGLWESWHPPSGPPLETCTIITTDANELTRPIHPRMPVILTEDLHALWLNSGADDVAPLLRCLGPYARDDLELYPVSTLVNSPRNDSPACIAPLAGGDEQPAGPQQMTLF